MHPATSTRTPRILTNHAGQEASPSWRKASVCFLPQGQGIVASLRNAFSLVTRQHAYDCLVLGAGRSDVVTALLRSVLPLRRVPCIMIDCLWSRHPNRFRHALKKLLFRIMNRSVDRFVVWAFHEIDDFSKAFNLPRSKFIFIPYHTTDLSAVRPTLGDYLFSGGNSNRDYDTVVRAVEGLPVRTIIASAMRKEQLPRPLPDNVELRSLSHAEYMEKLAGCRINIVALEGDRLRSAGQQTFLNSMALGKPTIVTDMIGPISYITSGEDGLLVPHGDYRALRSAIELVLKDPVLESEMGRRARLRASAHSTEAHFRQIIELAAGVSAGQ